MYILALCTIACTIFLFLICNKKIDGNGEVHNENISPVLEKIGNNKEIANEILNYIGNDSTKVEINKDNKVKASFYDCNSDKIVIKNTEDLTECSRIIHIAHECIHSIQEKRLLKIHFILSNIQILYFLGIFIYFFYNRNMELRMTLLLVQISIFIATLFVKITLESDAAYRGPQLAIDYLKDKIDKSALEEFKKEVQDKLYKMVPTFYFSLYMQGAFLLLIAEIGAIFIV